GHIADEWSSLLEDIYSLCRGHWSYLIPGDSVERGQLRALCAKTLAFEEAFLVVYTRYLIAELDGGGAALEAALRVLTLAPYREARVMVALEGVEGHAGKQLGRAATAVLERLRSSS